MSVEPPLLVETRGAVAVIRLNRPKVRNAMNPELVCRLVDALDHVRDDEAVRVAILTGTGEKAFCAGGDLGRMLPLLSGARAPEDDWDRRVLAEGLAARSTLKEGALDKPLIAAVNGAALAGGLELMLACDIRIAATTAVFGFPEVKRGLIPFAGSVVRLPRQIPEALALEMLLSGEPIDAATAVRHGLVNRTVEPEQVYPAALALAETIAANGPFAIAAIKRTVRASSGTPLAEAFAIETEAMDAVLASADAREGPAAFMEKRPPRFTGR